MRFSKRPDRNAILLTTNSATLAAFSLATATMSDFSPGRPACPAPSVEWENERGREAGEWEWEGEAGSGYSSEMASRSESVRSGGGAPLKSAIWFRIRIASASRPVRPDAKEDRSSA